MSVVFPGYYDNQKHFYKFPKCSLGHSVSQSVVHVPPGVQEEFGGGTHCTGVWWGYALHRA